MSLTISSNGDSTSTLVENSNIVPGDGPDMPVWTLPGEEKIERLTQLGLEANGSSYSIPSSISIKANGYSSRLTGSGFSGSFKDVDGSPLSGKGYILQDGEPAQQFTISGGFYLSGSPPPAVKSGGSNNFDVQSFTFDPAIAGVSYTQEDVSFSDSIGVIQYGKIRGEVVDYNGDPVPASPVAGNGYGASTDENGEFSVIAPGGNTITLEVLDGTEEDSFAITSGEESSRTFRFGKLLVEVVDGNYKPVEGAPVRIDGETFETNSSGRVSRPQSGLREYDVTVMNAFSGTFNVENQGERVFARLGPDASSIDWSGVDDGLGGINIKIIDSQTGRPVSNVKANVVGQDIVTKAGPKGELEFFVPKVGENVAVSIAEDNDRYRIFQSIFELPSSGVVEEVIELERRTDIGNTR
jgi:hypothetical protein